MDFLWWCPRTKLWFIPTKCEAQLHTAWESEVLIWTCGEVVSWPGFREPTIHFKGSFNRLSRAALFMVEEGSSWRSKLLWALENELFFSHLTFRNVTLVFDQFNTYLSTRHLHGASRPTAQYAVWSVSTDSVLITHLADWKKKDSSQWQWPDGSQAIVWL